MVSRVDDMITFVAYMLLPGELLVAMMLYPRFFLQLPLVAVLFSLSLFGFSFCCGSVHYLRAYDRNDTLQMVIMSWGTAVCSIGTALFLLPNIPILFRSVDTSLREQSADNAILVRNQRKHDVFRACVSHRLRNPPVRHGRSDSDADGT